MIFLCFIKGGGLMYINLCLCIDKEVLLEVFDGCKIIGRLVEICGVQCFVMLF